MKLLDRTSWEVKTEEIDVTPEMAARWFEFNTNNRKINIARVNSIADDIIHDRFQFNGETIKFDREGRLIDGQHRLAAIIKAGKTVKLLVVWGLEPVSQMTIDIGSARTTGQIAQLRGITHANEKTALAVALIRYQNCPHLVWQNWNTATKAQVVDYTLHNDAELGQAVIYSGAVYRAINVPKTPYGLLAFLVNRKHGFEAWHEFHDAVVDGAGLRQGDPRLVLRNQMAKRVSKSGIWAQQSMVGVLIKSWNFFHEGRAIKTLFFRQQELPLPEIL